MVKETYPEPRKIHIVYDSLFQKIPYLEGEVLLEIGARSLFEPTQPAEVKSLVSSQFEQINTSVVSPIITTI
nr:nucleotidyl transferase AbiEii/AbiGii toxin family protein [Porphyromonas sp.]